MTTEPIDDLAAGEPAGPETTTVRTTYAGASRVAQEQGTAHVELFGNLQRDPVFLDGTVKHPLRFREALSALYGIVGSDYRYAPKDRTAYAAFMRMRRETAHLNVLQAQQAYFGWLLRNDPMALVMLDPIITVHPDQVLFEVFSKDEGTYASLGIRREALDCPEPPVCGTTNIDFSQSLFASIQQMRSYRATRLTLGKEMVKVATTQAAPALEKQVKVPDSWVRGFLQVQSAATLPRDVFHLAPIDLYNVLRHLRMNGDRKGQRRGLRIELVPAEAPRLVLEPWETVIPSTAGPYKGKVPRVMRVWGRRRLMLIRRLLPYIQAIEVHLLGSGLPSFWVLRCGEMTLTLGMTGFTAANWSQAVSFDLLLPRKTQDLGPLQKVLTHLSTHWVADLKDLARVTGLKGPALLEAVQLGCQQGKLMYDLAGDVYRLRPLTEAPLDLGRLEYRNPRERTAHDLLTRRGAVKLLTENRIVGTGIELTGKVTVSEDKREYRPQLLLGDEGFVNKAECTCPFFRKQGLKSGPCAHLVALRLAYAEQEVKRQKGGDPRGSVNIETRTYSKRDETGEDVIQVALDRQKLRLRWGRVGKPQRVTTLRFNTVEEARAAYFARIDDLANRGYLDATAG